MGGAAGAVGWVEAALVVRYLLLGRAGHKGERPDWIVMKCLEKDRTRCYETANGLTRDIQRHLADEPLEACPPSAGYRLKKYVRRNKGKVVTASLVLLALAGGLGSVLAVQSAAS
jgi:hypothetical protein